MVLADDTVAESLDAAARRTRDPIVKRVVICLVFAGIEGVSAAALVLGTALFYGFAVLGTRFVDFPHLFYAGFALLTGLAYGAFSAFACGRLLAGEQRLQWSLSNSFYGWTTAIAITVLTAFLGGISGDLSRVTLTAAYLIGIPVLLLLRSYVQNRMADRIRNGELHFEKVAVVGDRVDVVNFLLNSELWRRGHKLVGALYLEDTLDDSGVPQEQAITDFARQTVKRGADQIILVGDLSDMDRVERMLDEIKRFALNVIYAPATPNRTLKILDVVAIGPNNALRFMRKPINDTSVLLKRALDIVVSGMGLLVLAPFLGLVALAIVIDSRGPVIYRQARRGFNGEAFMIWKFRSMSVIESGFDMKQAQADDPRITRVGRFLRGSSVDELPQLVNVLLGQMSLVGPRPHAISHDEELSQRMAKYAHRQRIKPGITGWAQVNGYRGETTTTEQLEGRIRHDIYYIENWSIFLDLWTLLLTFVSPAAKRNAR
jgi:Undecaprenyl-phosphate glucose phosphotransferase